MGEQQYQQNMNYQQNGNYQQAGYGQAAYQQQNNGGQQYSQGGVCPACGMQLINGVCPRCTNAQMMAAQNRNDAKFTRLFMSPNEKLVATLGNNYIQNYLHNGSVRNGFAVVSDKRAYFYGTSYTISYNSKGKPRATKTNRSQVVDLKDITGTGFKRTSNIGYVIAAVVFTILAIFSLFIMMNMNIRSTRSYSYSQERNYVVTTEQSMSSPKNIGGSYGMTLSRGADSEEVGASIFLIAVLVVWIVLMYKYYQSRLSLISIQYAGGEIAFDIKWFSQQEINNFQQQLRLAKDRAIEASENAMADRFSSAVNGAYMLQNNVVRNSGADELMKYAQLLEKGYITQEEYDNLKRRVL